MSIALDGIGWRLIERRQCFFFSIDATLDFFFLFDATLGMGVGWGILMFVEVNATRSLL